MEQPQGYLAAPPSGNGPGVLVLHAWWGLNDTIKGVCDRLAAQGFVAFAPDLYHGRVARTIPEAEALGAEIDRDPMQAKAEIKDAARFLAARAGAGGLAAIGFSLGAYFVLDLSATDPDTIRSVTVFYGTQGDFFSDFSNSKADYLGHFAENDVYETRANVEGLEARLKAAGRPLTFHTYPGTGHWFFEPDRPDAYNAAAAALAWERTLAFLKRPAGS